MPNRKFNRSKTRFPNKKFIRSKRGGSVISRLKSGLKRGVHSLKGKLTGQPNITSDSNNFTNIAPLGSNVNNIVVKSSDDIYKDLETLLTLRLSLPDLDEPQKLKLSEYLSKKPDSSETIFNNLRKIIYYIVISISYLDYTDRNKKILKNLLNTQIKKIVSSKYVSKATEQINIIIMESDRDQIELEEQLQEYNSRNANQHFRNEQKIINSSMRNAYANGWEHINSAEVDNIISQTEQNMLRGLSSVPNTLFGSRGGNRKIKKSRKNKKQRKRIYA